MTTLRIPSQRPNRIHVQADARGNHLAFEAICRRQNNPRTARQTLCRLMPPDLPLHLITLKIQQFYRYRQTTTCHVWTAPCCQGFHER